MLFLPENFGFMGESSKEAVEHAEPPTLAQECENSARVIQMIKDTVTGNDVDIPKTRTSTLKNYPTDDQEQSISLLSGLQTIAQEAGLWISACMHTSGAPPASTQQEPRIYNTHLVVDNTGGIRAQYKKIHLFDVSIPGQVELQESRSTAPGNQVIVCDSPIGRLGLSTCYDVRFPELYIQLVKRGVEVVLVPSAFTVPTGKAHWHTLLRARAIETQCFVVAAAQYGVHNSKRESYGHSLVVDPWGTVLVDVGGKDSTDCESLPVSPHVVVCDLNFDLVAEVRQRMPIQQHRETADYDVV
jgi:predicted amidohydrolase